MSDATPSNPKDPATPAAPAAPVVPAAAVPPASARPAAASAVNPADARVFLNEKIGDPNYVTGLDDARALELHGRLKSSGVWPEDWRDQLVGNDEKLLKRMQRYASPRDVANALIAAQNRISSGELKSTLKEAATPAEIAAWRAENGIPESPDKYDLKMPDGIVFGEEDKPFIESFAKAAHNANFHPDQVKAALAWYHQDREAQIEAMAAKDAEQRQATEDELRTEWGNDFRRNSNMIFSLLDTAPKGVKDMLMGARGPDDKALFNDANVIRFFDSLARQINPVASVVPSGTGNIGAAIGDEIQKLEKMMGNKNSEYWKGANAEKNQARYRELVDARDRIGTKKAA